MKDGFKDIIGKRIATVVVAKGERPGTRNQVFLVFADGTRFEIYGESFSCCAGVDKADGIADYVENGGGSVVRVYGNAAALEPARAVATRIKPCSEPGEPISELLGRDLEAWRIAKAAIESARRAP